MSSFASLLIYTNIGIIIGTLPIICVINSPSDSFSCFRLSFTGILLFAFSLYFALAKSTTLVCMFFTSEEYTNHLDSIWIFHTNSLVFASTLNISANTPSSAMILRALITYSPERCHFHLPSTSIVSNFTLSFQIKTTSSYISIISPFFIGIRM